MFAIPRRQIELIIGEDANERAPFGIAGLAFCDIVNIPVNWMWV